MINETSKLTYEMITSVTNRPVIIWGLVAIFIFVFILFLLYGIFGQARTSQGKVIKGIKPIQKLSFWICWFILWVLPFGLIILFLIFPIWSRMGI